MTAARLQQCACSSNRLQLITAIMTMRHPKILTHQYVRNEVDIDHVMLSVVTRPAVNW